MDLSAFPLRAVLRWDLAARLALAVAVPLWIEMWRTGGGLGPGIVAALVAALVSLASLGPELSQPRWVAVAAIGTPIAVTVGVVVGPSATGGLVFVFLLYLCQGVLAQAGMVSRLAWFPVATAGLIAAVLATGTAPVAQVALAATLGSLWAVLLMLVVPRVVRAPRLEIPAQALSVDTQDLRRMVTHPSISAWVFPLLLGGLASALLVAVDLLTGGFKPFWAVFALAGVLAPTSAETRRSTWQTVGSTLGGILLAGAMLASELSAATLLTVSLVMALVGATLLLSNGLVSKLLLTPLPVLLAATALGQDSELVLTYRLVEYLMGAGVGFVAALAGEWLSQRLSEDQPAEQTELVG